MSYLGSWKIDDLLTFTVVTTRVDTGAATDADSPATYRVYEDETSTPILTGTMALLDSANTAGFYSEQITLSAANGFEKGKSYNVYIAATVNSVAGATTRNFQMEAEVDANTVSASNVSANTVQIAGVAVSTSTAQLGVNVVNWNASAVATPTVAGVPEVDVTHWIGTAAATPDTAGYVKATIKDGTGQGEIALTSGAIDNVTLTATTTNLTNGVTLANGAHGGVAAVLTLEKVIVAATTGINTPAVSLTGRGSSAGLQATGGATGNGIRATGGATSGAGLSAIGTGTNAEGIVAQGNGTSPGIHANGTGTGAGLLAQSGSGVGIYADGVDGMYLGGLAGDGIRVEGTSADIRGDITGNLSGSVGSVAAGGITAASIATDAIDNDAIAGNAVTEIQAGLATAASIAALNNLSAAQVNAEVLDVVGVDVIADSVAADGSRPTIMQALLMINRFLTEKSVTTTTVTVNKEDGTTQSMTFTLNDAASPTSITRAT